MTTPPAETASPPPAERANGDSGTTTIAVGLDGSEPSWSAFWWACGEAKRTEGEVLAVYVSCMADTRMAMAAAAGLDSTAYTVTREEAVRERSQRLESEVAQAAKQLAVPVRFIHLQGDPAVELLQAARDMRCDVVAVGRSAKLHHRIAGSLGRRLSTARKAPIIVIVP